MYFSRSFIVSALLGLGAAKTHQGAGASPTGVAASETLSAGAAAASPTGGQVATHVIQVGGPNGTLVFSPASIQANPGDLVQFQFNPKNHSVVQATFDNPCVPIQNIMANKTDAFFSGFMPAPAANATGTKETLTYTIRVLDKTPVWFYCSQANHCQEGMVGAINAATTGNKTIEAYKALAASASENLSPGQGGGKASSPGTPGTPGTASSSGAPAGGQAAPTGTAGTSASGTSGGNAAQQTANAAPGRLSDVARQSFLGLGLGGIAAFMVL